MKKKVLYKQYLRFDLLKGNWQVNKPFHKLVISHKTFNLLEGEVMLTIIMDLYNQEIFSFYLWNNESILNNSIETLHRLGVNDSPFITTILHCNREYQYFRMPFVNLVEKLGYVLSIEDDIENFDNQLILEFFYDNMIKEMTNNRELTYTKEGPFVVEDFKKYLRHYNYEKKAYFLKNETPQEYREKRFPNLFQENNF
ncbi:hypothetical protein [Italian clover phyllody phytoplasma]|uniref:hypothetical protein n=1 Tax=Italian clover phyllody phytoplasma TaxID=1196420 RepID=UPI0002F44ECA|nr:hypothetical protein [Italian clover phyllody phytoplasma]